MIENSTYYLFSSDIQTILSGTMMRLRTLLTPLCGNLPFGVSPSATDIGATAETLRLCNRLLTELRSRSTLHDMKSKDWLDDDCWRNFSQRCGDAALKVERHRDSAATASDFMAAYNDLEATIKDITILVSRKNRWDGLFGNFSTQQLYGEIAAELYERFVSRKDTSHMRQMKSLATMYEVLREQCGGGRVFMGPDFDSLLTKVCGIQYNASDKPRGRYRQVGEWWSKLYGSEDITAKGNKPEHIGQKPREYLEMRAYVRERLSGGKTSRKDAPVPDAFKYNTV